MNDLLRPLKTATAPKTLRHDIYHKMMKPQPSRVLPWVVAGAMGMAAWIAIMIATTSPIETFAMDEITDTYSTIDNPWAPPAGNALSLLH